MKIHFLATLITALCIFGCTALPVPKTAQGRIIDANRSNISTSTQVSGVAKSILLSSGYDQARCMQAFDDCLTSVKSGIFGQEIRRSELALFAELYYARALYLQSTDYCQDLNRPPLNPYYANAPKDPKLIKEQQLAHHACLTAYKDALFKTLNYSYAYLFYDALTGKTSENSLVKESDIKAQDLYHVSLNALIGEIYKGDNGAFAHTAVTPTSNPTNKQFLLNRYQDNDTSVNLYVVCEKNSHEMTPVIVSKKNTHAMTLVDPFVVCEKNTHFNDSGCC